MIVKEITNDIFYVGVNDRVKQLFEALWPLPYGVSYNSYIVAGTEKVALIDTVCIEEIREYFNNIHEIAADRTIDYLIVNHMEPDHSAGIPEVIKAYPNIKIIGNSKTIDMIRGFYHIDDPDRYLEIKDKDTVSLGGRTLSFHMTPMVHWPETMMTYVEEEQVLFSGDAFGAFGALNGAVVDRDMDTEIYFPEMYRYYANIVGKYGRFVQAALKKLADLPLNYICPTHGPVWHEEIKRTVDIYSRLSAYESEEGVVIVYGSMYGNTAEIAEMIATELAEKGVKRIKIHNASTASMSEMITDAFRYKTLIIGSPTYSMRLFPPVETLLNALETREVKNKVFAAFSNHTWAPAPLPKLFGEYAERLKLPLAATMAVKQSAGPDTKAQVAEFVSKLI